MQFDTSQDTQITKSLNIGVHASTMGTTAGASFQKGKQEKHTTTEKAGISLKGGKVITNNLNLKNGSKVETSQLSRQDDKEGLPTVTGSEVKDSQTYKSKGLSIETQPNQGMDGQPSGALNNDSQKEETLHRPTVIADNVTPDSFPGINTDPSKESELITEKKRSMHFSGTIPTKEEIKSEVNQLKKRGGKALLLFFKPSAAADERKKEEGPSSEKNKCKGNR